MPFVLAALIILKAERISFKSLCACLSSLSLRARRANCATRRVVSRDIFSDFDIERNRWLERIKTKSSLMVIEKS